MVVAILTLLLIFYILFLPPEQRAALLGEGYTSDPSGTIKYPGVVPKKGDILFSATPGSITYQARDVYEYDIPSFTIYQTRDSAVLAEAGNFFVRRGWFEQTDREVRFFIDNIADLETADLSLTLKRYTGVLDIEINGRNIYGYESDSLNIGPIRLQRSDLRQGENILRFSLANVGLKFWTVNEYYIERLTITATTTDRSKSQSTSTFYIDPTRSENVQRVTFRFIPDCRPGDVGTLEVDFNARTVFSGVPDCGIMNSYEVSPSALYSGQNSVSFRTTQGTFLIDRISVRTELSRPQEPIYYFDLDSTLFYTAKKKTPVCGESDGICPRDCSPDADRDCCFERSPQGYWCPGKTDLISDRCVERVTEEMCSRCPQGYEDKNRKPPKACEGLCGDNTDGVCPLGCSPNYDKDCCFAQPGNQFWCYDLPITGIDYACTDSLTFDSCRFCPSGYVGKTTNPRCDYTQDHEYEEKLKTGINIELEFKFTDSINRKEAILFINGFQTNLDTRDSTFTRRINDFVESGTNSIRIVPGTELDIRELNVRLE